MRTERCLKLWARRRFQRAAVLLEVVLALVLFVGAAAVIGSAIGSALDGVERQKLNLHAANLAQTVFSELQIGLRSTESAGPEPFSAPYQDWTWQLGLSSREERIGGGGLTVVEVIVRHEDPAVVLRLAQALPLDKRGLGGVSASGGKLP